MDQSLIFTGYLIQGGLIVFTLFSAYFFGVILPYFRQKVLTDTMKSLYASVVVMFLVGAFDSAVWILPEMTVNPDDLYLSIDSTTWLQSVLFYIDISTLPVAMLVGYSLTTGKFKYTHYVKLALAISAVCLIENLTGWYNLQYVASFVTCVACLLQFIWCSKYIHRFEKRLRDTFSNLEHRSMRWFLYIIVPLLALGFVYVPLCQLSDKDIYSIIYDLFTLIVYIFTFICVMNYHIDKNTEHLVTEQFNEIANKKEEESPAEPEVVVEPVITEKVVATEKVDIPEVKEHPFTSKMKILEEERFYLDSDVNIDWLCNKLGTNRHYVSDYLNNELHVSFYEYINNLRLQYAEKLLLKGEKVSQVAYSSGFNSDHTFRRLFKEKYSLTPTQYQKQTA